MRFFPALNNTGAVTIAVDGLPAVAAKTVTGAAMPADYLRAGVLTTMYYDGTQWIAERIIENGSNANGVYWRWSDGRMTCKLARSDGFTTAAAGGGFRVSVPDWTYPLAFTTLYRADYRLNQNNLWSGQGSQSVTALTTPTIFAFSAITGTAGGSFSADGLWY